MLERCLKRLEWDKVKAREAREAADEADRERLAMMSVRCLGRGGGVLWALGLGGGG